MPDPSKSPTPTSALGRLVDRQLARLAEALSEPEGRGRVVARAGRQLRSLAGLAAWPVLVGVPGLLLFTRWAGELHAPTAFLIFLPPAVWVVPPALLLLPTLLLRWKLGVALAVFLAFSPWLVFGWHPWGGGGEGEERLSLAPGITVLTYNAGQSGPVPLRAFIDETAPDIILMQDVYTYFHDHKLGNGYAAPEDPAYPHMHRVDEYVLYSKFPILSSAFVRVPGKKHSDAVGVRHVLDVGGREIVVYNVHLPTPRYVLKDASPAALALDYLGPDDTGASVLDHKNRLKNGWDAQCDAALSLLAYLSGETLPTIVGGDFNFPRQSYLARCYRDLLAEAEPSGGAGYTFPGTTRNPLSFGLPWMRLDHLFAAGSGLVPGPAVTESGRRSQHLATAATFRFELRAGTRFQ